MQTRRKFIANLGVIGGGFTLAPSLIFCKADKEHALIDRLLPAPVGGGFAMEDYWVWGSSVIKGEEGKYHMFASRWPKEIGFDKWVTNSEIVRAVAEKPAGPYTFQEVVLPVRDRKYFDGLVTHNPRIVKYGEYYVLYYMATTYDFEIPGAGDKIWGEDGRAYKAWMNKRIGMAYVKSVNGPWERMDKPVIEPRPENGMPQLPQILRR